MLSDKTSQPVCCVCEELFVIMTCHKRGSTGFIEKGLTKPLYKGASCSVSFGEKIRRESTYEEKPRKLPEHQWSSGSPCGLVVLYYKSSLW